MRKKKTITELKDNDIDESAGGGMFDDDDVSTYMVCDKCGLIGKWRGNYVGIKFLCPNCNANYLIGKKEEDL